MARHALRISEKPRTALTPAELLREHVPGYRVSQNRVNRSAPRQTELRFAQTSVASEAMPRSGQEGQFAGMQS